MIDIHSHLLFDIDDGPSSIAESCDMMKAAEGIGINTIFLTPHLRECNLTYIKKAERNFSNLASVNSNINIILGYEVELNKGIINSFSIEFFETVSINSSRHILVELPGYIYNMDLLNVLYSIRMENYIPVIAHPERVYLNSKNINFMQELLNIGCKIQTNIKSFAGMYGKATYELANELLKNDKITFIASDAHNTSDYKIHYRKALRNLNHLTSKKILKKLLYTNPDNCFLQFSNNYIGGNNNG